MEKNELQIHHDNAEAIEKELHKYISKAQKSDYVVTLDEYLIFRRTMETMQNMIQSWYKNED